jgi:hypothetical protein
MPDDTTVEAPENIEASDTKSEGQDISKQSSGDIKDLIEKGASKPSEKEPEKEKIESPETPKEELKPEGSSKPEGAVETEEWFDKEKGFRTKEDALKSYTNLQRNLTERAQREKQLQSELDLLKAREQQRPLTQEEKDHQEAVEKWKNENKDAISFLKEEVKRDLIKEKESEDFNSMAMADRKVWKEEFDKDDSRKVLWPVMEEIYSKSDVMKDFYKNPFPFIEAVAFKENFPTIAERIKAEAVEQYKSGLKEAEEAERSKTTGRPGGAKKASGDIDPSKMSSSEISDLLPRNEDG